MQTGTLDLEAYLTRIGAHGPLAECSVSEKLLAGELAADFSTLSALHVAHVRSIPFENLEIQRGRPVPLDLPSLWDKIVRRRRGGYCFEQNTLFAAILSQLGFRVTTLLARVRFRAPTLLPRTHMLLRVELDAGAWLADVGFGGYGLLAPLPFVSDTPLAQAHDSYRLTQQGNELSLEALFDEQFEVLYSFTLEPSFPIDFEAANYYTATHPASRFVQNLVASKHGTDARYGLLNREFSIRRVGAETERRTLDTDAEVRAVLERYFDLRVEPGQRFRAFEASRA